MNMFSPKKKSSTSSNDAISMILDGDDDFLLDSRGLESLPFPPAPDNLLSSALPQSLLQGSSNDNTTTSSSPQNIPSARPRRLWNIQDSHIQHIPSTYPPLNPNSTTYVANTAPSIIAVRIAECLRKRSIAAEYDDESISASAMTVDRCYFQIQLWRGKVTPAVDFSHGVVVECSRIRGDTISFHHACRAVLAAARGESTGDDCRKLYQTNGIEFHRLVGRKQNLQQHEKQQEDDHNDDGLLENSSPSVALHALEQIRELLNKDRLECQEHAMERLVNLTTRSMSGHKNAIAASLKVLEETWLYPYILAGSLSTIDEERKEEEDKKSSSTSFLTSIPRPSLLQRGGGGGGGTGGGDGSSSLRRPNNNDRANLCTNEVRHETKMRSYALRVFCNALSNLSTNNNNSNSSKDNNNNNMLISKILNDAAGNSPMTQPNFLRSLVGKLVDDLKGANRPPSVVEVGDRLASIHETALAVRSLCILGESSATCKEYLQSDAVLDQLEIARTCGRATHLVLQQEAEQMYSRLTEDVRSF